MRQARWIALLATASLVPQSAKAQGFGGPPERRVAYLIDQLREQMWTYRQELDYFKRAPEYRPLADLRYRLRGLAINVAEARGGDFRSQHGAAREMEQAARDLFNLTRRLETRTDLGNREEVRRRADQLTEEAVEIRVLIGRLQEAVRLDYAGFRPGRGGPPPVAIPSGGPGDRRRDGR